MKFYNSDQTTHRRGFLGLFTTGAAALSAATLLSPLHAIAKTPSSAKGDLTGADA